MAFLKDTLNQQQSNKKGGGYPLPILSKNMEIDLSSSLLIGIDVSSEYANIKKNKLINKAKRPYFCANVEGKNEDIRFYRA